MVVDFNWAFNLFVQLQVAALIPMPPQRQRPFQFPVVTSLFDGFIGIVGKKISHVLVELIAFGNVRSKFFVGCALTQVLPLLNGITKCFSGIRFHPVHKWDTEVKCSAAMLLKKCPDVLTVLVRIRNDGACRQRLRCPIEAGLRCRFGGQSFGFRRDVIQPIC